MPAQRRWRRTTSAEAFRLRVMEKGALVSRTDFRIAMWCRADNTEDEKRSDAFLHQKGGGKKRLETAAPRRRSREDIAGCCLPAPSRP